MRIRAHLNPFSWSERTIKMVLLVFFALAVPIYVAVGLQPANASEEVDLPKLEISSIGLEVPVKTVELKDGKFEVPDYIVGAFSNAKNKTFLMGHSSTVFGRLKDVKIGDTIVYMGRRFEVLNMVTLLKNEISMKKILAPEQEETLVLMTCAGTPITQTDYTHRLILTAKLLD